MADFDHFEQTRKAIIDAAATGMEKAMLKLQADTQAITHVDTGALRRSWTHKVIKQGASVYGAVGSNLKYAVYEDDYHGNLSVALNNDFQELVDTVAQAVKSAGG